MYLFYTNSKECLSESLQAVLPDFHFFLGQIACRRLKGCYIFDNGGKPCYVLTAEYDISLKDELESNIITIGLEEGIENISITEDGYGKRVKVAIIVSELSDSLGSLLRTYFLNSTLLNISVEVNTNSDSYVLTRQFSDINKYSVICTTCFFKLVRPRDITIEAFTLLVASICANYISGEIPCTIDVDHTVDKSLVMDYCARLNASPVPYSIVDNMFSKIK